MDPFRFRPTVTGLEDRLTPAASIEDVSHAAAVFQQLQPAMQWLAAHQNTLTVFKARSALSTSMVNIVQASYTTIQMMAEHRTEVQALAALDSVQAAGIGPYVSQVTGNINLVYHTGLAALQLGRNFGATDSSFLPPAPPTPPPPPVDSSDSGMTSTIPDLSAEGWQNQSDGLRIRDVVEGTGTAVGASDTITVQYTGWLTDGSVFDSSRPSLSPRGENAQPLTSPLSGLIKGWQEGVPGMKPGGIRQLFIPPELGYGAAGSGSIPPNAQLVFEIKLISSTPTETSA